MYNTMEKFNKALSVNKAKKRPYLSFIDSNGYIAKDALNQLLEVTDKFMLDIKAISESIHYQICGKPNQPVLDTIRRTHQAKKLYELRYVIVPNVNDIEQELENWQVS